ncbi:hypothetical protein VTK56DRAFT_67 [Thermocarpiscus australiensis]
MATVAVEEKHFPLSTGGNARQPSAAGQGAGNAHRGVIATATISTTTATFNIPAEDDGGVKADQPSVVQVEDEVNPEDAAAQVPPFTPLDFKIPDEAFRNAKQAAEGTPESFWAYSLYRGPDADGTPNSKVKVHYCTSSHTTERVLQQYFIGEKVIGFDLEWAPDAQKFQGARKNVSLIQLASESRIGLFHLAAYPKNDTLVAPSLKKIMEDPEVSKVGVWVKGDCTRLERYLGIKPRGQFELSHLYKLVKYSNSGEYGLVNKKMVALATQVKECLGLPLYKGRSVRSSDWSQTLRMDQIIYSASDAYAAVQLYAILDHQRKNLNPTPPLPHHAELNLPIRLADGVLTITPEEPDPDADALAEDKPDPGAVDYSKYAESVGVSTVSIESEADASSEPALTEEAAQPTPKLPAHTPAPAKPKEKDARVTEATLWAAQFRLAHPKTRAAPSSLRAYYLWHKNEGLGPAEIAALLRDPPLQTATVLSYILEAVRLARLPFEKRRLREEVLALVPPDLLRARYKSVLKACEAKEEEEGEGWSMKGRQAW